MQEGTAKTEKPNLLKKMGDGFLNFFTKPNDNGDGRKVNTKRIVLAVVAFVMIVLIIAISVFLGIFYKQEKYDVDLSSIIQQSNLLWSDEFDGDALNTDYWTVEEGARRGGYWSADQCIVSDGTLKIRTEKKADGHYYMSGLHSKGKVDFKYGYVEARMQLPKAIGIWSAFWSMPTNGFKNDTKDASINGAEIDIMEAPAYPKQRIQQAIHIGGYEDLHESTFWAGWLSRDAGDVYDNFHTYGFYWDQNIYKFYIDGICVWTTSYNKNVSQVLQYLFLSVETTGEIIDGVPTPKENTWIGGANLYDHEELLPADFSIDYVRIYRIGTQLEIGGVSV